VPGNFKTNPQPFSNFQKLCTTKNFCFCAAMPKATPSMAELPKAPAKARETKDTALYAQRKAAYDAAYEKYQAEMEAYNAGQKEREQQERKERAAASSAVAATSSSNAAEEQHRSGAIRQQRPRCSRWAACRKAAVARANTAPAPQRQRGRRRRWQQTRRRRPRAFRRSASARKDEADQQEA